MTTSQSRTFRFRRVLPNILAFGLGLGLAYFLKWSTTDLVWSLWLCSLVLGYTTLFSALAGGAYLGFHEVGKIDRKYRKPAIIFSIVMGVFFLGFFSVHFGGFHAGHSVFLNQFFPIKGIPKDGFGRAFANPALLCIFVLRHLVKSYGLFLVPAMIVERKHVFAPLIKALAIVRKGGIVSGKDGNAEEKVRKVKKMSNDFLGNAMGRPYINVMRMHLLIFFFAFAHFLKLDSFFVYAVVYFVYFFPWSEVRNARRKSGN